MGSMNAIVNRANRKAYNRRQRITCETCGRKSTDVHCGRWCWSCYASMTDHLSIRMVRTDAERERRIQLYTERAMRREPLFG